MSGVINNLRKSNRTSWLFRPLPDFAPVDADSATGVNLLSGVDPISASTYDWMRLSVRNGAYDGTGYYATLADPQVTVSGLAAEPENGIWRIPNDAYPPTGTDGAMVVFDTVLRCTMKFFNTVRTGTPPSWSAGTVAVYYWDSEGICVDGNNEPTTDTINGVVRNTGWDSYWKAVAARTSESKNRGHRGVNMLMHTILFNDVANGHTPDHPIEFFATQRTSTGSGNNRLCHPNSKNVWPMTNAETSNPGSAIPEGARFRVKSNAKLIQQGRKVPEELTTGECLRLIKALQRFGVIFGDSGGSPFSQMKVEYTQTQPAYNGVDMWASTTMANRDCLQVVPFSTHWEMVQHGYVPPVPKLGGFGF